MLCIFEFRTPWMSLFYTTVLYRIANIYLHFVLQINCTCGLTFSCISSESTLRAICRWSFVVRPVNGSIRGEFKLCLPPIKIANCLQLNTISNINSTSCVHRRINGYHLRTAFYLQQEVYLLACRCDFSNDLTWNSPDSGCISTNIISISLSPLAFIRSWPPTPKQTKIANGQFTLEWSNKL